ncbi:MAG: radical SAM protein [Deltaproteobacteria bacterium]|nr:radical SAM protein [Deltaproteobacteria bacterium]MBI3294143.1 radical SAM protein [Deltaproteobacteria bacterium]
MNIVLCTTPIRPVPTSFPPVGTTSLLERLHQAGYSPYFFDIDGLRPDFETVVEFFRKQQPDILGISAVVSTAYRYVRDLTHAVRRVSPNTQIVLGGNLAASAEILLKKCPIDLCVVSEGERVIVNLVRHFERFGDFRPTKELNQILGISYLDRSGSLVFTGYEAPIPNEELPEPNYDLLEKFSDINRFITNPFDIPHFARDPRAYEPHRATQKTATVLTSKGCVARCTFCHRWDKGYRAVPVEKILSTIHHLKNRFNVGFFQIGDENFGSDKRQVDELVEALKPLDILFHVAGVRVFTVEKNPKIVGQLKAAGCTAMYFGMESGSPKMLEVMEKRATLEQNLSVIRKLNEEKMYTIVQLVLGMPGENRKTIQQTTEFVKLATEGMDELPNERISANLFQALPGTPGYEYMRRWGMVGTTLDSEEAYLLKISDVDAASSKHYQNCSEETTERAMLWQHQIIRDAIIHYYKRRGWTRLVESEAVLRGKIKDYARGGYFRIAKFKLFRFPFFWRFENLFRAPLYWVRLFNARVRLYGPLRALGLQIGLLQEENRSLYTIAEPESLREIVQFPAPETLTLTEAAMLPLRAGR